MYNNLSEKLYMLTIDVAHPPRHPEHVETELNDRLSEVRGSSTYRAIKVIHGYGSKGGAGSTKDTVRDWAYRFKRHFKGIIYGEDYHKFDHQTQKIRNECGYIDDSDLEATNSGITILWIK